MSFLCISLSDESLFPQNDLPFLSSSVIAVVIIMFIIGTD